MELKVGLKYTCPSKGKNGYNKIINITDTTVHVEFYENDKSTRTGSDPIEKVINYFETGYFKIKNDFVIPEKWCIINQYPEVRKYLAKTYGEPRIINWDTYDFIGWDDCRYNKGCHGASDPTDFTEGTVIINFKQFKKYFLNQKINYNKLITILNFINNYER